MTEITSRRLWQGFFLCLIGAYAAIILLTRHAPLLQDYPDWVYQAALFGKLISGHPAANYTLRHYPVPNSVTTVGAGILSALLGWEPAARVWLVLVLGALAAATLRLLRSLGAVTYAVLPVLASTAIVGLDFWNGSVNFELGMAILLFFLAHLLKPQRSAFLTALLLLLCFFTHMLPCGAALLALLALAVQTGRWQLLRAAVPTLFCLVWYTLARDRAEIQGSPSHLLPALVMVALVFALYWKANRGHASQQHARSLAVAAFPFASSRLLLILIKLMTFLGSFGLMDVLDSQPGQDHRLWDTHIYGFLAPVGAAAAVICLLLLRVGWIRIYRGPASCLDFMTLSSLALFTLFLLSPVDAVGVTGIDTRFLHLALAVGVCMLSLQPGRGVPILATLAVLVCLGNLYQFAAVQSRVHAVSIPYQLIPPVGTAPVAPSIRTDYYDALQQGNLNHWIFPTAIFRWRPH